MRTKIGAALVAAALLALVPVGVSQAQDTSFINVIHGIGEGDNPVDVYVGAGASPTEWNLTVEDLVYGELAEVGDIPAGTYNVLVCNAAVAPADTINACPSGAVNSNAGNEVVVEAGLEYALVAAYGGPETEAPGRPIVAAYELEASCLETATTARAQGLHAAAAPTVDITANGDVVFNDVSFGESAVADVPAGTYDIGVQLTDGTPVLEVADAELAVRRARSPSWSATPSRRPATRSSCSPPTSRSARRRAPPPPTRRSSPPPRQRHAPSRWRPPSPASTNVDSFLSAARPSGRAVPRPVPRWRGATLHRRLPVRRGRLPRHVGGGGPHPHLVGRRVHRGRLRRRRAVGRAHGRGGRARR